MVRTIIAAILFILGLLGVANAQENYWQPTIDAGKQFWTKVPDDPTRDATGVWRRSPSPGISPSLYYSKDYDKAVRRPAPTSQKRVKRVREHKYTYGSQPYVR